MLATKSVTFVALVASAASLACSDATGCTYNPNLPLTPGPIWVGVVDSVTGKPIADSASGQVQSVGFSDILHHSPVYPDTLLYGAGGAGTYAVAVTRPGYQRWLRTGVVVTTDHCGIPSFVQLSARLQRSP